jgi:hypothetical protein
MVSFIGSEIYSLKYKRNVKPGEDIYLTVLLNYHKHWLKLTRDLKCDCSTCTRMIQHHNDEIDKINKIIAAKGS